MAQLIPEKKMDQRVVVRMGGGTISESHWRIKKPRAR